MATFQQEQLSDIDVQQMGADLMKGVLAEARGAMQRGGADPDDTEARAHRLASELADVNFTNVARETLDKHVFQRALRAIDEAGSWARGTRTH